VDLKYRTDFWNGRPVKSKMFDLCEALGELGVWVRLHYVYPYPHVDDILPLMQQGKVLPYLDIPFQHASPRILQLMKRPGSAEKVLERIRRWREQVPELTIRSTFIVGFPGETEAEFAELLDFLEDAEIDRAGAFIYSPVEGAAANALPDPVDPDIAQERLEAFMDVQARVSARRLARKVGQTITVLVDEIDEDGAICRSMADAPEIDGNVFVDDAAGLKPGDRIRVTITDSDEHDLWGERA
jgi:ribosomal protein S12 methylthiotransferase